MLITNSTLVQKELSVSRAGRLGGARGQRKSMIVQTSPILGGGARCHSPLAPPGALASPLDSPKVSGAGFVWAGPTGGQPGQGVVPRYRSVPANQKPARPIRSQGV